MIPLYVVDEIEAIVGLVSDEVTPTIQQNEIDALTASKIEKVNYQKGSYLELLETLAQKDGTSQSKFKYPLVFLQQDFTERRTDDGFYANTSLRIIIIHQTEQTYKITDRYNKVFKPVLYPIYYELLKQISLYANIVESDESRLIHDKTDRAFWGTSSISGNTETILNDYVDAIDLENLELKFYIKTC